MKNVPINFDCIPARFQRAANFQSLRGIRSTNKTKFHIKSLKQIFIWKFKAQGSETAYVSQSLWCTRWSRNCYLCGDRFMEQPRPCLLNQRHLSSASVPPRRPTVLKHCEEAGKKKNRSSAFICDWMRCLLTWVKQTLFWPADISGLLRVFVDVCRATAMIAAHKHSTRPDVEEVANLYTFHIRN